jgi:hypothetical protein
VESSGYIPTEREKNDPRFKMALTRDVRPGATGKNANKLGLKTDAQGRPQVAKPSGLVESIKQQLARFKADEDYSPDAPPGPENPPTMPAGTVRIGVSDVYDWYKLGQHISNMKGLGRHDFGQGPPDSIISFGDEETEHKFIQDLEKTGAMTQKALNSIKDDKLFAVVDVSTVKALKSAEGMDVFKSLPIPVRQGQTVRVYKFCIQCKLANR